MEKLLECLLFFIFHFHKLFHLFLKRTFSMDHTTTIINLKALQRLLYKKIFCRKVPFRTIREKANAYIEYF